MLETNMKDKVILVTGATSGMGETVAKRFVNEGAKEKVQRCQKI